MEYGLTTMAMGSPTFVPISEGDYNQIKVAQDGLFECLFIEEKFDLVVENFLELETTLLELVARSMLYGGKDYQGFQVERGLINRRFINLLTAGRTYEDHVKQHINKIFHPDSKEAKNANAEFKKQYDARIGYRVMVALRNFVQHRDFPVYHMSYQFGWVGQEKEQKLRYAISPYLRPAELRIAGGFKNSVLEELESIGEQFDLKFLTRDYVEGLWVVHSDIRSRILPKIENWEATLNEAIQRFQEKYPEERSLSGLGRNTSL